ncbi:hypothetical protein EON65_04470 [archaeon]|nr:MAG: hypothetical protein EON65_04470 [archaeon]
MLVRRSSSSLAESKAQINFAGWRENAKTDRGRLHPTFIRSEIFTLSSPSRKVLVLCNTEFLSTPIHSARGRFDTGSQGSMAH